MDYIFYSISDDNGDDLMEQNCLKSFGACSMAVLEVFFAAQVSTDRPLDVLFGFIVVIVLLTIVIAIVNDAWNGVENQAAQLYWESRVSFLSSIETIPDALSKITPAFVKKLGGSLSEKIDQTENMHFFAQKEKKFSWRKDSPYNRVTTKDEYENPYEYFAPEIARTIHQAQSLRNDMYWIRRNNNNGNPFIFRLEAFLKIIQWLFRITYFIFLIILGFCTLGFFWPRELRRFILSYGYENGNAAGEENSASSELDSVLADIIGLQKDEVDKMQMKSKLRIVCKELERYQTRVQSMENLSKKEAQMLNTVGRDQVEQVRRASRRQVLGDAPKTDGKVNYPWHSRS